MARHETTASRRAAKARCGGALRLPLGNYAFSYTVEDNVVSLDYADPAVYDAAYSYLREGSSLTLDTNTGSMYRLEK